MNDVGNLSEALKQSQLLRAGVICTILFTVAMLAPPFPVSLAEESGATDEYLIIPGVRVGRITKNSSEESLIEMFGGNRVFTESLHIGEGFFCRGSRVSFADGNYLVVSWLDAEARSGVDRIEMHGGAWATSEGIGPLTSLKELEAANGKPFEMYGMGWDYAGTVASWKGGALAASMPQLATDRVFIRLQPRESDHQRLSSDERRQITGDGTLLSSHTLLQRLDPRPYEFFMTLGEGRRCEEFDGG